VIRIRLTLGALAEKHFGVVLGLLLSIGLVGRVIFDLNSRGVLYDLDSLRIVATALKLHPGTVYGVANANPLYPRWPYPPGFFPVIIVCRSIAAHTGLGFEHVIRFPSIICDLIIAWVVQDFLGSRGASHARRLAAAALVALGPSFAAISAIHGQIDADGIMPAVIAVAVWERRIGRRAVIAGALIGLGASVKSVPALTLLALLPSVDSRREAAELIGAAGAVLLVAVGPYVVRDGLHWFHNLNYNGGIGLGSLSLLAQPDLALNWLHVGASPVTSFSSHLHNEARLIAAVGVLGTFAVIWRGRPTAPVATTMLFLAVYAFGVTFFMQYMVWGLPFMLMSGYLWQVLALEVLLFPAVYALYHGVHRAWAGDVFYVGPMILVWAILTISLGLLARRQLSARTPTELARA
jgi:uncharacterized membrane protein